MPIFRVANLTTGEVRAELDHVKQAIETADRFAEAMLGLEVFGVLVDQLIYETKMSSSSGSEPWSGE